jgi:hypothetical protein
LKKYFRNYLNAALAKNGALEESGEPASTKTSFKMK